MANTLQPITEDIFFSLPLTHDKSTSKHDMQTLRQIVRRGGMIIPCVYSLFAVLMSCFFGVRATFFFFLRYRRSTFLSSEQTLPFHFQDFSITRVRAFCHVTLSSHYHNSTQSPRLSPHHTEVVTTRQDDTPLRDHQCTLRQDHRTSNATCRADTPHVDKSRPRHCSPHPAGFFSIDAMNYRACHDVTPCRFNSS